MGLNEPDRVGDRKRTSCLLGGQPQRVQLSIGRRFTPDWAPVIARPPEHRPADVLNLRNHADHSAPDEVKGARLSVYEERGLGFRSRVESIQAVHLDGDEGPVADPGPLLPRDLLPQALRKLKWHLGAHVTHRQWDEGGFCGRAGSH